MAHVHSMLHIDSNTQKTSKPASRKPRCPQTCARGQARGARARARSVRNFLLDRGAVTAVPGWILYEEALARVRWGSLTPPQIFASEASRGFR